jgi:hypothetical protein
VIETPVKVDYWLALWPGFSAYGKTDAPSALKTVLDEAYADDKIGAILKGLNKAGLTPIHPIMYQ